MRFAQRSQRRLRREAQVLPVRARPSNTSLRRTVALAFALLPALALGACGSSGPSATSLVNDTFSSRASINSALVDLSLGVAGSGSESSKKPVSLRLSGPFQSNGEAKFPSFSLQLQLSASGHALAAGATSTGSALYVQLGGSWFSVPSSTFSALQQSYAQATKSASSSKARSTFASLGIEPSHWLSEPSNAGTATIAGVQTYHVTAALNVSGLLSDVSKLSSSTSSLGLSAVPGAGSLSPAAISELGKSITSAHVDIYTGKSDHILRKLDVKATINSTPQTQAILGGLRSATVTLSLQFSNINQPQAITAPANPKPFTQLVPALQQLMGALGAATG
jgi:hypothetical protein